MSVIFNNDNEDDKDKIKYYVNEISPIDVTKPKKPRKPKISPDEKPVGPYANNVGKLNNTLHNKYDIPPMYKDLELITKYTTLFNLCEHKCSICSHEIPHDVRALFSNIPIISNVFSASAIKDSCMLIILIDGTANLAFINKAGYINKIYEINDLIRHKAINFNKLDHNDINYKRNSASSYVSQFDTHILYNDIPRDINSFNGGIF